MRLRACCVCLCVICSVDRCGKDLPQGAQALRNSRDLLNRYMWTQLHSAPTGGSLSSSKRSSLDDEALATWGNVSVPLSAVVLSYRKTIKTLRERREPLPLAQALNELALLFVSRGGDDGRDEAVRLWTDAVDAASGLMDALQVALMSVVAPRAMECLSTCAVCVGAILQFNPSRCAVCGNCCPPCSGL